MELIEARIPVPDVCSRKPIEIAGLSLRRFPSDEKDDPPLHGMQEFIQLLSLHMPAVLHEYMERNGTWTVRDSA